MNSSRFASIFSTEIFDRFALKSTKPSPRVASIAWSIDRMPVDEYDSEMGYSHKIGKVIGAKFDIPHGMRLGLLSRGNQTFSGGMFQP